ncbi:ABC transporter ATP-binding protein [Rubellimicrobium rubrum]|uniref:ABC transporter ATP-binding protein n=2 Tax=Rubellimicrobium rubrum TaxID=2585369 RepID=A0A5C4MNI9_9RHOB|nr:ABC transporter ATP-binding protein [Rubellimicrobium rubrum]
MLAESGAMLLLPALAGRMAGAILETAGVALAPVAALLVLVLTLAAVLRAALGIVSGRATARLLAEMRTQVHDHLQALPLSFHQRHTQGDLLALSTYEIERLGRLMTETLAGLPAQAVTALGAVILMARIDMALALAVPLIVPVFYLALKVVGRRLRGLAQSIQEAEAQVVATASEDLAMLPAIKAFTREDQATRRFGQQAGTARDLAIREAEIYAVFGPATSLVAGIGAVLLLALAGQRLQAGAMSPSEMVSLLLYAALLTRPVAELAHVYGRVQSARGTLARLSEILDTPPEPQPVHAPRLHRAKGAIAFEDVYFAYPGRESALRGVTLSIRPGETLALTGANGAGKTTMTSLLLRFEDPQQGTVRLDGMDLRAIALRDLRRQIGLVPQRPLLFHGTVRDNIGFGRDGATVAEIEAAARLAQAHDFILDLPEGYDTRIGENGVRLSGGQGQRIALARAILKDPPILILDEATSMYDLDGESAFVAAAASALKNRTVVVITHRPATLALADRVVRLDAGRIVADRSAA